MDLSYTADRMIPKAKNKRAMENPDALTRDIVASILKCYEQSNYQVKDLAPYLDTGEIYSTCKKVWQFIKSNIAYKVDPENVQWVKEPAKTWHDRQCDCKGYAIFIASLLKWLGIKGAFRFVSFSEDDPEPTHVYVVVKNRGKEIILDDVMPRFDKEKKYCFKYDYPMTQLYRVSGMPPRISSQKLSTLEDIAGIGCTNSPRVGLFSDILQPIKRILSGSKAQDMVVQISPAFLYMYIPSVKSSPLNTGIPDILSKMPAIVQSKADIARHLDTFVHDSWGYTYKNLTDGIIRQTLTQLLTMDPQDYLAKVIGYNINSPHVYGIGDLSEINNPTFNMPIPGMAPTPSGSGQLPGSSQTAQGVLNAAETAGASGAAGPYGQAGAMGLQLIQQFAGMFINYNITPAPSTAMPAVTDWNGFPTAMQIAKYIPTLNDPLGALGTNGGKLATSSLTSQTPSGSSGPGLQSGFSGITGWIMAGLLVGGLFLMTGKKGKR